MVVGLFIGCWHIWEEKQYYNDIKCFRTVHDKPAVLSAK